MQRALYIVCFMLLTASTACSNDLVLAEKGRSAYCIALPARPLAVERKAAAVLQQYFREATGVLLPVVTADSAGTRPAIHIAYTKTLPAESYHISVNDNRLLITGGPGKGVLYAVYTLLERFLGCRKWDAGPPDVPRAGKVVIPGSTSIRESPAFLYREVHLPAACQDAEYLDWHKLHRFEDLWGAWGHTFFKLVPPAVHFKQHPEYFSLVNGVRRPQQLCLSNEAVLNIAIASLQQQMAQRPDAVYWSISPNDDIGYCTCRRCQAIDQAEGGPQGSLVRFVNRIAARFPDKVFTTLAYTYTSRPPLHTAPASNVYVMLSSIDAYRTNPLAAESSAVPFRNNLKGWQAKTPQLFVWDYFTQFTNYLAPFPNLPTLPANLQYLHSSGVKGVFEQGSGYTYSDLAELKGYLLARLLWNPHADAGSITQSFLQGYYGKAAPFIQAYLQALQEAAAQQPALDIYGNPVNEHSTFLSPARMDAYSTLLDKAETAAEGNPKLEQRVQRIRLGQEYTYLQQARFYGIERHGIFEQRANGSWEVKAGLPARIQRFVTACQRAGVNELSEGGLSPEAYAREWQEILQAGVRPNKALHAAVQLAYPFAPEYPAKGARTLTDGNPGYNDFSYNWLCFYGQPLLATIDLGKALPIQRIALRFLEDPRHWIFRPAAVCVEVSADGAHFQQLDSIRNSMPEEHYDVEKQDYSFDNKYPGAFRYIRVKADNWPALPDWRYRPHRQAMIACDEVWVE